MGEYEDGKDARVFVLTDEDGEPVLGVCAGIRHPNRDAPESMDNGSFYLRKNGKVYFKRGGRWRLNSSLFGQSNFGSLF